MSALSPYLRDLSGYLETTPGLVRRRELPAPQVVVILELGPPIRLFERGSMTTSQRYLGGFVAGIDDTFSITEHDGLQKGIQLNFTPLGARLFFGIPMHTMAGRILPWPDLLPREHGTLVERLAEIPTWDARFDVLESILLSRLGNARPASPALSCLSWAYDRIEASGGTVDMGTLVRELGYSQKHVISLFREHVGMSPKMLSRLVRFDRLMARLKSGDLSSWTRLALDLGYYDQSHLVRDVRQFTGGTPTEARGMLVDFAALCAPVAS